MNTGHRQPGWNESNHLMNTVVQPKLSQTFQRFLVSEQAGAVLLLLCTVVSLALANSPVGVKYVNLWQWRAGGLRVELWINDALMAVFFLLIGLELKRELTVGELSSRQTALLPALAALGGICFPALIHLLFNRGTPTQAGIGIPMATDIAFALGVLALAGKRIPGSLKVFLTALAVMDDLGAIIVIALFYTAQLSLVSLMGALAVWGFLLFLNRVGRVTGLLPYLLGGGVLWFLTLQSGVHATIAGVLLAFAIPFTGKEEEASPSHQLEHLLQKPVAFLVLPVFALANTGVLLGADWFQGLWSPNSAGILLGLTLGKPIGIALVCWFSVRAGLCRLPGELNWNHIFGAGLLGGIGFTMSIFITNLAFAGQAEVINASKTAILLASLTTGIAGFLWLKRFGQSAEMDDQGNLMENAVPQG